MSKVYDVRKYAKAKVIVEDLKTVLWVLNVTQKLLYKYKKYKPINDVLGEILQSRYILRLHYKEQLEIVKAKGKIVNEKKKKRP